LLENKKIRHVSGIVPTQNYTSVHFQNKLSDLHMPLSELEVAKAKNILPPLCRSYFDIGCYVPSIPAFDKEFKCIDFLTVLQIVEIDPSIKKKLFGGSDEV
jgi:putative hemolysin